ncbi:hypothetical protein FE257_008962 [Aspergillus nanangensis]|uniref:RRM domain-containing protein n=1 Tax=Aspergillus nanangensis TaxID=2582783 RepID=A0AAD4CWW0_ASPNN|nr:hypothetical protein FE257_008962 [Aspergillus nanangensis]
MANMDRSLDEIIAERPQRQSNQSNQSNRDRRPQGRRRDGVKKTDLFLEASHSLTSLVFDTEPSISARPSRAQRRPRGDRYSPEPDQYRGSGNSASTGAKIRVENLHYDITESDLGDLFNRIGPISNLSLVYDRAGRSEGLAFVTYTRTSDARTAISEFDGANAKGQPIRLTLIASGGGGGGNRRDRNPFDNVERPRGSLFDRVERPRNRNARSLSPGGGDTEEGDPPRRRGGGGGRRAGGGGGAGAGRYRRSDVSKPAPGNIDRYVPGGGQGQRRSPGPRAGDNANGGRRQGDGGGRRTANGRPKKTQEELDAEMDDYWGGTSGGAGAAEKETASKQQQPVQAATTSAPAAGDDDIDMIE